MRSRFSLVVVVGFAVLAPSGLASAYKVKKSSHGAPLRWAEGQMIVEIAMHDSPDGIDAAAATQAIAAAFETWAEAIPAAIDVSVVDRPGEAPRPNSRDRRNLVRWVHDDWDEHYEPDALAVTLTTYDADTGEITDADIVINAEQYRWFAGNGPCAGAYDLQNVITHEVGHLFGLAHDGDHREATMYPSAPQCETKKRDLHEDDLAGLHYLYADVGPPETIPAFGCSIGGGGTSGLASLALVVAAMLLASSLRRRARAEAQRSARIGTKRIASGIAALSIALVAPAVAEATTVRRFSLDELSNEATVVARGRVVSQKARRAGSRVHTDTIVSVEECWRGACGAELRVRQLGGEADGVGLSVEGTARLGVGDEVVVFLRATKAGAWTPVGMAQGVFHVAPRGRATRDLSELVFAREDGSVEPGDVEDHALDALRRVTCKGRCR